MTCTWFPMFWTPIAADAGHSSDLYCFYCIVSVLINKIFIHSFIHELARRRDRAAMAGGQLTGRAGRRRHGSRAGRGRRACRRAVCEAGLSATAGTTCADSASTTLHHDHHQPCTPDMELGHWVTGWMGHLGHLSRPGHRVIILTRCQTRVFPVFEKSKRKIYKGIYFCENPSNRHWNTDI